MNLSESYAEVLIRRYGRAPALSVFVAEDFLRGGAPSLSRFFDRKGAPLATLVRKADETLVSFHNRSHKAVHDLPPQSGHYRGTIAKASSIVIGGLGSSDQALTARDAVPRSLVRLPDAPLHLSQRMALALIEANRRTCLVCGRRWGKSALLTALAVDHVLCGRLVAIFAPTYRLLKPLIEATAVALHSIVDVSVNKGLGEIRLRNGGGVDFWSLDYTQRAARGRKYHLALVDEAAHDEGYLRETLEAAIAPALLDYAGKVVLASTPNGLEGAFWECANVAEKGYVVHRAPTEQNPHLPREEIKYLRDTTRPEIVAQEIDAQFVDTAGATIFPLPLLLLDGEPHPDEFSCEYIGLAIDSNSGKGGPDRDGVGAVIFGVTLPDLAHASMIGARVVLLDWEIVSLAQGGVPGFMAAQRDKAMAWHYRLKPLRGLPVAHIEPMGNAYSVIEAARACGLNPQEIDTKYVSMGKDGRALAVEPHAAAGRVKIGQTAFKKRSGYRSMIANHLIRQVTGFRAFDKDAYKREDDLFDAAMYSVLVSLGDGVERRWAKLKRVV